MLPTVPCLQHWTLFIYFQKLNLAKQELLYEFIDLNSLCSSYSSKPAKQLIQFFWITVFRCKQLRFKHNPKAERYEYIYYCSKSILNARWNMNLRVKHQHLLWKTKLVFHFYLSYSMCSSVYTLFIIQSIQVLYSSWVL